MRAIETTLLYRWFDQVWNNLDEDAIDRLMAVDGDFQGIVTETGTQGAPGFKLFFREFTSIFKDIHIDVEDVVSEDDREAARTVITAVHIPTGKNVVIPGLCMIKKQADQIAHAWNNYDFLSMHQQLGQKLVPAG